MLKHAKFLFSATNQHGVHSPFVFNYITKCIYQKKVYKQSKTTDVLLKSIAYFNYKNIQINGNETSEKIVKQTHDSLNFNSHINDLIFIKTLTAKELDNYLSEEKIHNNSMLIIKDIYANKTLLAQWKNLIKSPKATVTIDLYYCGVIFVRQEQVKEHFKIRI